MKLLPATARHELISLLRNARAEGGHVNGVQAARDCAGIIARLPHAVAQYEAKKGRGRKPTAIHALAVLAADTYFYHAGKGPGSTVNDSGKLGGHYPKFVGALARLAGVKYNPATLPALCNDVRKALSLDVGLGPSRGRLDYAEREATRATALKSHVTGYEDLEENATENPADGFPVFDGYEPVRRHVGAKRRFSAFLKSKD